MRGEYLMQWQPLIIEIQKQDLNDFRKNILDYQSILPGDVRIVYTKPVHAGDCSVIVRIYQERAIHRSVLTQVLMDCGRRFGYNLLPAEKG